MGNICSKKRKAVKTNKKPLHSDSDKDDTPGGDSLPRTLVEELSALTRRIKTSSDTESEEENDASTATWYDTEEKDNVGYKSENPSRKGNVYVGNNEKAVKPKGKTGLI